METIDETRYFLILHKHGEPAKTLRPPLGKEGIVQMLKEKYVEFPTAKIDVLTIELEKSSEYSYHLYKSGIDVYPQIEDGKKYLENNQ